MEGGNGSRTPQASQEPTELLSRFMWLAAPLCALMVGLLMAAWAARMNLSPFDAWLISILGGFGAVPYILAIEAKQ